MSISGELPMRRFALLTGLLTVATVLTAPTGAAPALANTSHGLGLTSYRALEVDETTGHVFVSGNNVVVVTDLTGARQGVISDLPGAGDLALSDDGTKLFVALTTGNAIAEIDATDPRAR
jgi:DNA-binding beta-propeller fold protein YncE